MIFVVTQKGLCLARWEAAISGEVGWPFLNC
jgi:hypothetical protein